MAMVVASLVSVLLIVAAVFVALIYRDTGDSEQTTNYIVIFLGFVATIVTNIVGLAKTHLLQDKVEEIKQNTTSTEDSE